LDYRILGPLEVDDGDRRVPVGGHKPGALLAVLLLRANEVVSVDELVESLWGAAPPGTAAKTVQAYVSRLRKALGDDGGRVLETRGHGYVLLVAPGELDADRFAASLERSQARLAAGDPAAAADELRAALAEWRGAPLADFAYDDFAQSEIGRLEELRLAALETLADADLALGRDAELIPELQALVSRHPLRERLRASLMLALYRAGRQAEALDAYQQGRQALASELGLEPSPALQQLERQILEHDPALGRAPGAGPRLVPRAVWRHPRRLLAAGAAIVVIAAGAIVLQLTREAEPAGAAGAVVLDPESGEAFDAIPLGSAPSSIAVGAGGVWVLDANDRTITKVDPATREVMRTFSTTLVPTDIAAEPNALWVANGPVTAQGATGEVFAESVSRVDPESGEVDETVQLPRGPGGHLFAVLSGLSRQYIAATHDAVWAINGGLTVSRIDARTTTLVATVEKVRAQNIAAGEGDVWVTEESGVAQIDPGSNRVSRRIPLEAGSLAGIAVGAGAVWVADPFGGAVWRIDHEPTVVKRRIEVDAWVAGLSFGEGAVWATNEVGDAVYRIDPRTNRATLVQRTPAPRGVAAGEDAVWVTAAAPPSPDSALPRSACGDVVYGGTGSPDVLIVSNLPLKGDVRRSTLPMTRAIELVLEQRNFEAGGVTVGYQSCDSASAQSAGSDVFRCGTNAKAYARNLRVVGIVGSYDSSCTYWQLPITNRATGGPLAMVSPSNTHWELTEDDGLYPTGVRNYVRIAAQDHLLAVGQAALVRSLGRRSVFVLSPRDPPYGPAFAPNLRTAARRLGIRVAGTAVYDSDRKDYTAIARRVARAEPDAVVVADILEPDSGALVRDLRTELGPDVTLIAPDGFMLFEDLHRLTGPAASSIYMTQYGVPNSDLPPRGKQFLASYAAQEGSGGPDFSAAYGAQAAELLLDAIARSDGGRASVTRELLRTRVTDGILGAIRFDRKGDLVSAPITVMRAGSEGFVVDRVVTADSTLLRGR
jgi:DNA-binding SARP family transcriptional activator/ABC-type branched-subunit amino acid transport system substrate-binding protein/DNA-binding beta-propeller fold protein YncE